VGARPLIHPGNLEDHLAASAVRRQQDIRHFAVGLDEALHLII
jgi:hypothetical protein